MVKESAKSALTLKMHGQYLPIKENRQDAFSRFSSNFKVVN